MAAAAAATAHRRRIDLKLSTKRSRPVASSRIGIKLAPGQLAPGHLAPKSAFEPLHSGQLAHGHHTPGQLAPWSQLRV